MRIAYYLGSFSNAHATNERNRPGRRSPRRRTARDFRYWIQCVLACQINFPRQHFLFVTWYVLSPINKFATRCLRTSISVHKERCILCNYFFLISKRFSCVSHYLESGASYFYCPLLITFRQAVAAIGTTFADRY